MSYWFGDPHTLVLPACPDRFTQFVEAWSTTRKIGNRFRTPSTLRRTCLRRVRYSAHAFAVRTEMLLGL